MISEDAVGGVVAGVAAHRSCCSPLLGGAGLSRCIAEMLHDRARIHVQAGAGGDGCTSFRREAHVPRGGPDGGDGGHGGAVVLVCDDSLRDLQGFRRRTHYRAGRGGHGEGLAAPRRRRRDADDRACRRARRSSRRRATAATWRGAAGSCSPPASARRSRAAARGGKGNKRFATPTRQAPRFAERGLAGRGRLARAAAEAARRRRSRGPAERGQVLAARAAHARRAEGRRLPVHDALAGARRARRPTNASSCVADIPGLIEGASEGAGPRARLPRARRAHAAARARARHRARADAAARTPTRSPTTRRSSASWPRTTRGWPRCRACSRCRRCDLRRRASARARRSAQWRERLGAGRARDRDLERDRRSGSSELAERAAAPRAPRRRPARGAARDGDGARAGAASRRSGEERARRAHGLPPGRAQRLHASSGSGPSSFAVRGAGIERLLARYDVDNDDAMAYFEGRLRRIGVLRALEAEGFQAGRRDRDRGRDVRARPGRARRASARRQISSTHEADRRQARLERRRRRRRRAARGGARARLRRARRRCTGRATRRSS